jgi:hypothetical protein
VLTEEAMKGYIFWDITPCSLVRVNRCFGATYRLNLQGSIVDFHQSTRHHNPENKTLHRLKAVVKKVLRRTFLPKGQEVTEGRRQKSS